jgi:hypothetical protein
VITPERASVQTGEANNLGREPDIPGIMIGLTAEAGAGVTSLAGSARLNHWLMPVVTTAVLTVRWRGLRAYYKQRSASQRRWLLGSPGDRLKKEKKHVWNRWLHRAP